MTRRVMIGPLLIRPAQTHGSPVRTSRTPGPDGEKALHDNAFSGVRPGVWVTGAHCPFHQKSRPGRTPGPCVRVGRPGRAHEEGAQSIV